MIEIKNLHKIYNKNKPNEFHALKNISLMINKGEIIIIKGVSGSGKSTLLSHIGALSHPSSGEIVIEGENIVKLPDMHASKFRSEKIGFIFQSFNLIDELSVYENLLAPLAISNKETNIEETLRLANILHKKDEIVFNLSGGEKQRVAIARALINNPNIILADEPTANLDKQNSLSFIESLKSFKSMGKTVIVATHDSLFDNLDFIDRYIDIQDGEIL
jgi:putative ABC transport system ATP-binding protein